MKTRTTKKAAKASEPAEDLAVTSKSLPPNETNAPIVFVLPEKRCQDARIVTLPNPATSIESRYYCCPEEGLYEFTKLAAPRKTPSSWLLAPDRGGSSSTGLDESAKQTTHDAALVDGYTIEQPDLFIATPIDPLFLLLPALTGAGHSDDKQLYSPSMTISMN